MKISTEIWALQYSNFCVDIHHWFVDRERVPRLSPSPPFDTHAAMLAALRTYNQQLPLWMSQAKWRSTLPPRPKLNQGGIKPETDNLYKK